MKIMYRIHVLLVPSPFWLDAATAHCTKGRTQMGTRINGKHLSHTTFQNVPPPPLWLIDWLIDWLLIAWCLNTVVNVLIDIAVIMVVQYEGVWAEPHVESVLSSGRTQAADDGKSHRGCVERRRSHSRPNRRLQRNTLRVRYTFTLHKWPPISLILLSLTNSL